MRKIKLLVIHHTASPSGNVETIRRQHRRQGWVDIGYHAVLTNGHGGPDGQIQQGRPDEKTGSAVYRNNSGKLFAALVGQFDPESAGYTGRPTVRQLSALGHWLYAKGRRYGAQDVAGHKEVAIAGHGTACPGALPLDMIRGWYRVAVTVEREADVIPLHTYLAARGYEGKETT